MEIQKNSTVSSDPVEEKPSSKKGPSLEKLLSVWKAAETETRRKKEAELAAAHKVVNQIMACDNLVSFRIVFILRILNS